MYTNLPKSNVERGPLATGYVLHHQKKYESVVERLNNFFAPKRNATFERHIFRKMKQEPQEKINIFEIRLRTQAERCDFGDQMEDNIKDQVTETCTSDLLRRKILERGSDNLHEILKMAKVIESVSEQQVIFKNHDRHSERSVADVYKVFNKKRYQTPYDAKSECKRCGYNGHKAR